MFRRYIGYLNATDPLYLATRRAVLSSRNPWWSNGTAASGVGGPHVGEGHIWPMALVTRGWTATSDAEVSLMLSTLVNVSAGARIAVSLGCVSRLQWDPPTIYAPRRLQDQPSCQ